MPCRGNPRGYLIWWPKAKPKKESKTVKPSRDPEWSKKSWLRGAKEGPGGNREELTRPYECQADVPNVCFKQRSHESALFIHGLLFKLWKLEPTTFGLPKVRETMHGFERKTAAEASRHSYIKTDLCMCNSTSLLAWRARRARRHIAATAASHMAAISYPKACLYTNRCGNGPMTPYSYTLPFVGSCAPVQAS